MSEVDDELFSIINKEKDQQRRCIELIASEVRFRMVRMLFLVTIFLRIVLLVL